jgi:hypothetical protein
MPAYDKLAFFFAYCQILTDGTILVNYSTHTIKFN